MVANMMLVSAHVTSYKSDPIPKSSGSPKGRRHAPRTNLHLRNRTQRELVTPSDHLVRYAVIFEPPTSVAIYLCFIPYIHAWVTLVGLKKTCVL